jgi:hypothetical protein
MKDGGDNMRAGLLCPMRRGLSFIAYLWLLEGGLDLLAE